MSESKTLGDKLRLWAEVCETMAESIPTYSDLPMWAKDMRDEAAVQDKNATMLRQILEISYQGHPDGRGMRLELIERYVRKILGEPKAPPVGQKTVG